MSDLVVSICIITYNHESFIAQAIESVLAQETNFPFEIVIGEDCSTDSTRNICKDHETKNSEKISLLLSNKNLGMVSNLIRTLQTCRGKYVAILEGDDYWTDKYKLQKQVELLEENRKYTICFSDLITVDKKGNILSKLGVPLTYRKNLSPLEILGSFSPHFSSAVFRNEIDFFPEIAYKIFNFDTFFFPFVARNKGGAIFLNEYTSAYRRHEAGVYALLGYTEKMERRYESLKQMLTYFNSREEQKVLSKLIRATLINLFLYYFQFKQIKKFMKCNRLMLLFDIKHRQTSVFRAYYYLLFKKLPVYSNEDYLRGKPTGIANA